MRTRALLAAVACLVAAGPRPADARVRFSEPSLRFTYADVETRTWSEVRAAMDDPERRNRMGSTTCSLGTACVHSTPPEVTLSMDLEVVTPRPSSAGPDGWLPWLAGVLRHELLHVAVFLDMWQELVEAAGRLDACEGLDPLRDEAWNRAQARNADLDRTDRVPMPQDETAPPSPGGAR